MIRYRRIEQCDPNTGFTYGIVGEENDGSEWKAVSVVRDVSSNRLFAEELAEKCTKGQLSPLHLLDVVLDALP